MPNYCDNTLVIDAKDDIIEEILDFIRSDEREFDFSKIIPIPVEDDMYPIQESGTLERTIFKRCENGFTREDAYIRAYGNGRIIRKIDGKCSHHQALSIFAAAVAENFSTN